MSDSKKMPIGKIGWMDLTVPNAEEVRDFYSAVVGWKPDNVSMGEYNDFNMMIPSLNEPAAGVCHARGMNADQPPVWMVYIVVADLDASISACTQRGGKVLLGPKGFGGAARYCVIKDPAGAIAALYQEG